MTRVKDVIKTVLSSKGHIQIRKCFKDKTGKLIKQQDYHYRNLRLDLNFLLGWSVTVDKYEGFLGTKYLNYFLGFLVSGLT